MFKQERKHVKKMLENVKNMIEKEKNVPFDKNNSEKI